ncbi:hypothetical protein SAMD00020551_2407 [Mesobacillus selenatarsenatis SF-1]|uniref:Uncharacterized protein n=1 Tax=Mesobacillus selenatarsenatis (strain DSM 18680 / JCM 14380 / FERM P-15431 / SF-1) TaxID=1321606 RepID=A0A0A8X2T9_MESS1|nr:hypothetical protein SAMD00020551_2407 [Mesobacillus selenatarsenatis SF-1]
MFPAENTFIFGDQHHASSVFISENQFTGDITFTNIFNKKIVQVASAV